MQEVIVEMAEFNHTEFAEQVCEELAYTGMNRKELAEAVYISHSRVKGLLADGLKFREKEVESIKKIFGIK